MPWSAAGLHRGDRGGRAQDGSEPREQTSLRQVAFGVVDTSLPACGPPMRLAWQLFRRVECVFGRCGPSPITGLVRQARGRALKHQHTESDHGIWASHRRLSTGRWHQNGNIRSRRGFYMCVLCCVSIERASHESFAPCCHRSNVRRHLQRLDAVRCSTDGDAAQSNCQCAGVSNPVLTHCCGRKPVGLAAGTRLPLAI